MPIIISFSYLFYLLWKLTILFQPLFRPQNVPDFPFKKVMRNNEQLKSVINILLRSCKFESGTSPNDPPGQIIPQWILKTNLNEHLTIRWPSTLWKSRSSLYAEQVFALSFKAPDVNLFFTYKYKNWKQIYNQIIK